MISKIRKYQDSWLTKAILALTALSFMSLFGISGYVSSAGRNRAVIKVDGNEILQDEMNVKLQNAVRTTQNMFGDAVTVDDELRKNILATLVKQNVTDMIIAREAQKENVSISDELIERIISSQAEFMDASGRFSPDILRRRLSAVNMTEQEYINELKQNILTRHLVDSPVGTFAFPSFMDNYVYRIENQQKVFNYVQINPAELKIDRKISEEEIEQYYQDFAPQFEEAEKRDVDFIELKVADLAKSLEISEDDIKAYYDENAADYVVPEKRRVLQMVFDDEATANKALDELNKGTGFYSVAANLAHQDKGTTLLGDVTAESLLPELSEDVFEAKANQVVGPIQSDFGWHVVKVEKIMPKKETPLASVRAKIMDTLRQEQAYEQALNVVKEIEDKTGEGATLEQIAHEYHAKIEKVGGLKDDSSYRSLTNKNLADIVTSADFIETVFSYNENEVSQALETEDGFVWANVQKIEDAHIKDLDMVKADIIKLWSENEKAAIAQELVNDVVADLDNGETLKDIASRFNLRLMTTAPLKRGTAFAKLTSTQLAEVYQAPINTYRSLSSAHGIVTIVTPIKVLEHKETPTRQQADKVNAEMREALSKDVAAELIDAYAAKMDVRIKYRLMGLDD
jgi:peptidyl-prolyl cis-trans isomerase D